jgi:FHA domain
VLGIAALWGLFVRSTGSVTGATIMLVLLAAAITGLVLALRYLGINGGHPWVRYLAGRPWRDGRDVLQLGLRHLPEVFIVTPGGSVLAPNAVELRMNPGDLVSLTELMDIDLVNSSATEVYESHITAHGASLAGAGPAGVSVIGDPDIPPGRYRLRQGRLSGPAQLPDPPPLRDVSFRPAGDARRPRAGQTNVDLATARTVVTESATVTALAEVPLLRLVTAGCVSQTRVSGARAGRSREAELALPEEPTVSRVHAEFTFTDGRWHITNRGRNGVTLNGTPLAGEHVIRDGDSVGWGTHPGALASRVEIGWDNPLPAHGQR